MFNDDPETEAIVMIGEIGGTKEQEAAAFIKANVRKPVASLIVGQTAPAGRRMGHAGAVITGKAALASEKMRTLEEAGCHIIPRPRTSAQSSPRWWVSSGGRARSLRVTERPDALPVRDRLGASPGQFTA